MAKKAKTARRVLQYPNNLKYMKVKRKLSSQSAKMNWIVLLMGVVESSDIAPVKVEIPEICANNQEILDAVSHVADSFNFKLKMQQEESIFYFIKG